MLYLSCLKLDRLAKTSAHTAAHPIALCNLLDMFRPFSGWCSVGNEEMTPGFPLKETTSWTVYGAFPPSLPITPPSLDPSETHKSRCEAYVLARCKKRSSHAVATNVIDWAAQKNIITAEQRRTRLSALSSRLGRWLSLPLKRVLKSKKVLVLP